MNFDAPESVSAIKPLSLAGVTDQGVQIREAGLGCHRVAQQAHKTSHIRLSQLQPERRIRRRLAGIVAEQLIEALVVPPGGAFHPHQRSLAAQDREELRQKPVPRQEADAPTHPASRRRLENKKRSLATAGVVKSSGSKGNVQMPPMPSPQQRQEKTSRDRCLIGAWQRTVSAGYAGAAAPELHHIKGRCRGLGKVRLNEMIDEPGKRTC